MHLLGTTLKSKFLGSLVGSAIGDSLGSSHEGSWISEHRPQLSMGRWTDDTHMMIGVAESLIANKGFNGSRMAQTFIKNYNNEPWRGYASGPPTIFKWIQSGAAWNKAAKRLFSGAGSYGNGAAMRVAPVGLFYHDQLEKLRQVAHNQSQITHTHELGVEGAVLQAYTVALAVTTSSSSKLEPAVLLEKLIDFTPNALYKQKLEKAKKLLDETDRLHVVKELGNNVEAYNSVPTAIYSFLRNPCSFEESILYAISLGGDTDTIGAMAGAINGAYLGIGAIPEEWRKKLERRDYIEKLGEQLWYIKKQQET